MSRRRGDQARGSAFPLIYSMVQRIPRGRVATYGQIAGLAGYPRQARLVGWALAALEGGAAGRVPWQRVINASGTISPRGEPAAAELQHALLSREGVRFDGRGRVDLTRFRWTPTLRGSSARAQAKRAARPSGRAKAAARGRPRA